jgi:hypothetical protein
MRTKKTHPEYSDGRIRGDYDLSDTHTHDVSASNDCGGL